MAQAKLQITIVSAENLYNSDGMLAGKSDPYVICEVPGQPNMKFQTHTINNELNPVWNHVGEIEGFMDGDTLEFQVWDNDTFPKQDQLLGKAMLTAQDFYPNGIEGPLLLSDSQTNATLTIRVIVLETTDPTQDPNLVMEGQEGVDYQQVDYQQGDMMMEGGEEQVSGPQTLHINILNARGLYNADGILAGKSDPYCICLIPEKKHVSIKTNTLANCLDPDWNFTGLIHGFEAGDSLEFQVWDSDTAPKPDQLLGQVTLSPQDFANNPDGIEGVLQLSGGLSQDQGTLEVKIAVDAGATIDDAEAAAAVEAQQQAHHGHHAAPAPAAGTAAVATSTTHTVTHQQVTQLAGAKMGKLKVTIFSASGLYNADGFLAGKSDPYVICQVPENKHQKIKTKVLNNTLEPVWNHLGVINSFVNGHTLELLVYDSDTPPKPDQLLGKVVLGSEEFFPQGLEGSLILTESKAANAAITIRIEVLPDVQTAGVTGTRITAGTYLPGQPRPSVYQYPTAGPVYYSQPYSAQGSIQYMAPSPATYTYTTAVPTATMQVAAAANTAFEAMDTNHDGMVTRSEFNAAVEPSTAQPVATKVEYASAPVTYTQAPVMNYILPQPVPTTTTIAGQASTDLSATASKVTYVTMPQATPVTTMTAPTTYSAPYTIAPGSPVPTVSYLKSSTAMPTTTVSAPSVSTGTVTGSSAVTSVKMPAKTAVSASTVTAGTAPASEPVNAESTANVVRYQAAAAPVTYTAAPAASYRMPAGAAAPTYFAGAGTPYIMSAPAAATTTYAAPMVTAGATRVTYAAPAGATYTMAPTVTTVAPTVQAGATTLFDRLDKNHDGVISRSEFTSLVR